MKKFIALGLFLITSGAFANEANLSWIAPTTCVGGAPIAQCVPTGYRIVWGSGSCTSNPAMSNVVDVGVVLNRTISNLAPGTYCFAVKTLASGGRESSLSNLAQKIILPPFPLPPVLTVVEPIAMSVKADWEKLAFLPSLPVGIVPIGTLCDAEKSLGNGFYSVPRTAVVFSGANKPANIVAKCGA